MQISIDNQNLLTISDDEKLIMSFCYRADQIDDLIKQRLSWIINELCTQTFNLMKKEWEQKLIERGVQSLPTDKVVFAQLVFSQPDYKDRATRDAEETAAKQTIQAAIDQAKADAESARLKLVSATVDPIAVTANPVKITAK